MKIKDFPEYKSLKDVAFYHPLTKEIMYWQSQWNKGVWAKKDLRSQQIFPIFVNDLKEVLEWKVVDQK